MAEREEQARDAAHARAGHADEVHAQRRGLQQVDGWWRGHEAARDSPQYDSIVSATSAAGSLGRAGARWLRAPGVGPDFPAARAPGRSRAWPSPSSLAMSAAWARTKICALSVWWSRRQTETAPGSTARRSATTRPTWPRPPAQRRDPPRRRRSASPGERRRQMPAGPLSRRKPPSRTPVDLVRSRLVNELNGPPRRLETRQGARHCLVHPVRALAAAHDEEGRHFRRRFESERGQGRITIHCSAQFLAEGRAGHHARDGRREVFCAFREAEQHHVGEARIQFVRLAGYRIGLVHESFSSQHARRKDGRRGGEAAHAEHCVRLEITKERAAAAHARHQAQAEGQQPRREERGGQSNRRQGLDPKILLRARPRPPRRFFFFRERATSRDARGDARSRPPPGRGKDDLPCRRRRWKTLRVGMEAIFGWRRICALASPFAERISGFHRAVRHAVQLDCIRTFPAAGRGRNSRSPRRETPPAAIPPGPRR